MDPRLVAKITTQRTDNTTRTGTGYPVGANLLITALHVIEFNEADKTKSVTIEWPDFKAKVVIEPQDVNFAFDGEEQLDVVLLCCPIPEEVALLVTQDILETEKIKTQNRWETLGFPKVNSFQVQDVTGIFRKFSE